MWKDKIILKWFLKKEDVCVHWIKLAHDKKPVAIMKLSLFDS
jgi:hypothetical protein